MIIVDTTVWIDYLGGTANAETEWLDRVLERRRLALTDLILCEVLQGIREPGSAGVDRDLSTGSSLSRRAQRGLA